MKTHQGIVIRTATLADLDAINGIYNDAVLHSTATFQIQPVSVEERLAWFNEHPEQTHPVFVAESGGRVVGWGSLSRYHSRCAYRFCVEDSIYIATEHRRTGIGSLLLDRLVRAAGGLGHHTVIAQIADHNGPSIRLHEKFGFVKAAHLHEIGLKFDRWLDVVYLQRML
jgi:L-amino acid N-acyltransferase